MSREIFCFASNLAGKHYGGSAKAAVEQYGAIIGQGIGLQGDSYAIPTLDENFEPLPLSTIALHVADFIDHASINLVSTFRVVEIGCGIAKFTPEQIAPLFYGAPANCLFSPRFEKILVECVA